VTKKTKAQDPSQLEKSLGELEKIVEDLEGGDLPLDTALKQFEKGVGLSRDCQKALEAAEQRVSILTGEGLEQQDGGSSTAN
jgi:exodeoxyribonuclease VII small subunit